MCLYGGTLMGGGKSAKEEAHVNLYGDWVRLLFLVVTWTRESFSLMILDQIAYSRILLYPDINGITASSCACAGDTVK